MKVTIKIFPIEGEYKTEFNMTISSKKIIGRSKKHVKYVPLDMIKDLDNGFTHNYKNNIQILDTVLRYFSDEDDLELDMSDDLVSSLVDSEFIFVE